LAAIGAVIDDAAANLKCLIRTHVESCGSGVAFVAGGKDAVVKYAETLGRLEDVVIYAGLTVPILLVSIASTGVAERSVENVPDCALRTGVGTSTASIEKDVARHADSLII
jgi:hypothetical protein